MEKYIDLLTELLPVLATGIITFLVTKYTMSWNVPLDNMKISYNRVYYPLIRVMRNTTYKTVNHQELQQLMNYLLLKYDKYISSSTKRTYDNYLKVFNQNSKTNIKTEYMQFYDDVNLFNSKLRGKLGYVRANNFENFKSLSKSEQRIFKLSVTLLALYIAVFLYSFLKLEKLEFIIIILSVYLLCLIICIGFIYLKNRIVSFFIWLKSFKK